MQGLESLRNKKVAGRDKGCNEHLKGNVVLYRGKRHYLTYPQSCATLLVSSEGNGGLTTPSS